MSTVDWSRWGQLTPQEQEELKERYRNIIREESQRFRESGYRALNAALASRPRLND
jgi:hypothetical protein